MRKPPRSPISSAAWIIGCFIGMSIVTGTALSNAGGILLAGITFVIIAGSLALILKPFHPLPHVRMGRIRPRRRN